MDQKLAEIIRGIEYKDPKVVSIAVIDYAQRLSDASIELCYGQLWRIFHYVLKNSNNNSEFISQLRNLKNLNKLDLFSKLVVMPRENIAYQDLLDCLRHEARINSSNAVKMLACLIDNLGPAEEIGFKERFYRYFENEVLICSSRDIWHGAMEMFKQSKKTRFQAVDMTTDETFNILHDLKKWLDAKNDVKFFLEFMLTRTDLLFDDDPIFAIRYAMTLCTASQDGNNSNRTNDENIVKQISKYLSAQLVKEYFEYQKLMLALELFQNLVHPEAIGSLLLLYIFNAFHKLKNVPLNSDTTTINSILHRLSYLRYKRDIPQSPYITPRLFIWGERDAEEKLLQNERSFGQYMVGIGKHDVERRFEIIFSLIPDSDSHFRAELHFELLKCFHEIYAANEEELANLSNRLNRSVILDNFEVLKNWVVISSTSLYFPLITHFMILQDIESAENLEKMIDIAAKFLEKVVDFNFGERTKLMGVLKSIWSNVLVPAAMRLNERDKYLRKYRMNRFFKILEQWSQFMNRDQFVGCLLPNIDILFYSEDGMNMRYAMTLAQCGYDPENKHRIDPTLCRRDEIIVKKIYQFLVNVFRNEKRLEIEVEIAVQIFANFVKIVPNFVIDVENIAQSLKIWAQSHKLSSKTLKDKIIHLFEEGRDDSSIPSFETKYQVVSQKYLARLWGK